MNKFALWTGIHFYSIIIEAAKYIIIFLDFFGLRFTKWHLKERFSIPRQIKLSNKNFLFWIHGASLGEVKIITIFMPLLEQKYPECFFILTAVSETGVNHLLTYQSEKIYAVGYLPIDSVFTMNKMLKKYPISQLWIIETELWPSMIWTCLNKKISVNMINARIEKKSYSFYRCTKFFLGPLLKKMDTILVQNRIYAKRFESLGACSQSIHIIGNIKSQRRINRASPYKKNLIRSKLHLRPHDIVITVGCLHPDEASIIQETIEILISEGYEWKWLIIPRHIHKADAIREKLGANVLSVTNTNISKEWTICLVETFGILEDMYMISDASVLGGTFNTVGGHNIWEAVQYGIPVFFGQHFHTQKESYNIVLSAGLGFIVHTGNDLAQKLIYTLIKNPDGLSNTISQFITTQNNNTLAIEKYI